MRRKGSYVIPLILLVFIAGPMMVGLTMLAPGMADSLLQLSGYDTRNAPQAKSTTTFLRQHYMQDSLKWSFYQTSYELGQDGGGVSWSPGSPPIKSEIRGKLKQKAANDYEEWYLGGEFPEKVSRCSVKFPDFTFSVEDELRERNGEEGVLFSAAAEDIRVVCGTATANVTQYVDPDTEGFSAGNRYFLLYREMAEVVPAVGEELDTLDGNTYAGSGSDCGSRSAANSEARGEARDDAESAIESTFNSALTGLPGDLRFSESSVDPSASVTLTESASDAGECNCETVCRDSKTVCDDKGNCETECVESEQVCHDTMYTGAEASASPASASASVGITDERSTVPTEDGMQNLEFLVEDLSFSID